MLKPVSIALPNSNAITRQLERLGEDGSLRQQNASTSA